MKKLITQPITQPFMFKYRTKAGRLTRFYGTRSKCIVEINKKNGDKVIKNPEYEWIKTLDNVRAIV